MLAGEGMDNLVLGEEYCPCDLEDNLYIITVCVAKCIPTFYSFLLSLNSSQ